MIPTASPTAQYEVEFVRDVRIPTADPSVTLGADLHLPIGAGPSPLILLALPYRKDLGGSDLLHSYFARRGYACMTLDLLGTGTSDGDPRPPFSDGDADDAVAAIMWGAEQPWCDGNVGMWGHSYGGMTTMRTAARRPAPLKAIIPVQGLVDPEVDLVHPAHARGSFTASTWISGMIGNLLMPPMHAPDDESALVRWRERLDRGGDAHVLDLFRHAPGDDVWRERAVDAGSIEVPALCWLGWRDLFADSMARAFDDMSGPKRLIAGPWQHVLPVVSEQGALDFLGVCTAWWERWLRGVDNGADSEPSACFVQGPSSYWTAWEGWPEERTNIVLDVQDLDDRADGSSARVIVVEPTAQAQTSDPTVGALSGFTKMAVPDGIGLPVDSHDDDLRGTCWTSEPLDGPLAIMGRGRVTLNAPAMGRVVVKLHHVDPAGRSVFLTSGTLGEGQIGCRDAITLEATAYEVPEGHRLRVVVSDADFPRLWPLPAGQAVAARPRLISLPTLARADVRTVTLPEQPAYLTALVKAMQGAEGVSSAWALERDLVSDSITLTHTSSVAPGEPGPGRQVRSSVEVVVTAAHSADPVLTTSNSWRIRWPGHAEVAVHVETRTADAGFKALGRVTTGETLSFERTWSTLDRDGDEHA